MARPNIYKFSSDKYIKKCIYTITNKLTGKVYVGKTINSAEERWKDHIVAAKRAKAHFGRSLHKYGYEVFDFAVIDIAESDESLNYKEQFWIAELNTLSPNGYNHTTGGEGGRLSEETKDKLSLAHARRYGKEKSQRRVVRDRTPAEWYVYNEQVYRNRSNAQIGKKHPNRRPLSDAALANVKLAGLVRRGSIIEETRVSVTRNDGLLFSSIKDAAIASSTNPPNIVSQIKGLRHNAGGFQFKYGTHEAWEVIGKPSYNNSGIVCSNGLTYKSLSDLCLSLGVSKFLVKQAIKLDRLLLGFSFKYKEVET